MSYEEFSPRETVVFLQRQSRASKLANTMLETRGETGHIAFQDGSGTHLKLIML